MVPTSGNQGVPSSSKYSPQNIINIAYPACMLPEKTTFVTAGPQLSPSPTRWGRFGLRPAGHLGWEGAKLAPVVGQIAGIYGCSTSKFTLW
jgi:hypothetical protein